VATYGGQQPIWYEYPCSNGWQQIPGGPPSVADTMALVQWFQLNNPKWDTAAVFTFGLLSFLQCRYGGNAAAADVYLSGPTYLGIVFDLDQWTKHNLSKGDQARDVTAVSRWNVQLEGVMDGTTRKHSSPVPSATSGTNIVYYNTGITVLDGWLHEIHYESPAPYTSYKLWSDGPNGIDEKGGGDDISTGVGY
jgi:hypothetical protein